MSELTLKGFPVARPKTVFHFVLKIVNNRKYFFISRHFSLFEFIQNHTTVGLFSGNILGMIHSVVKKKKNYSNCFYNPAVYVHVERTAVLFQSPCLCDSHIYSERCFCVM